MIDRIKLLFGNDPQAEALTIEVGALNIFVGPNNSGKSLILREIEALSQDGKKRPGHYVMLDEIQFSTLTAEQVNSEIQKYRVEPTIDEGRYDLVVEIRNASDGASQRIPLDLRKLVEGASRESEDRRYYLTQYLRLFIARLDGRSRTELIATREAGDIRKPNNHLASLFRDDAKRALLRSIIHNAFGRFIVIDPSDLGKLQVRLSEVEPTIELEKTINDAMLEFMQSSPHINSFSDGVIAFVGIMIMIIAGDPKILLIDEPEAFLHPVLANRLGKEIGRTLRNNPDKTVFVSTHSPHFLMGCIQSGVNINIIRLTYTNSVPTARLLAKEKVSELMRDPLLRSTGVLEALFHESVVVTEADSDRAFYQEINERMLEFTREKGINNCVFLNAQNKQTIWRIVAPLRAMGIAVTGVYDIDVIKNGGNEWTKILTTANIPEAMHKALHESRRSMKEIFDNLPAGKDMKKGGVTLLDDADAEAFQNFINQLADYGIFILPFGELESWLRHLEVDGHGPPWLVSMFGKFGSNRNDANYVRPSDGDVWEFIERMKNWLGNPNRRGI